MLVIVVGSFSSLATSAQRTLVTIPDMQTAVLKTEAVKQFKPEAKSFDPKQTPRFNVKEEEVMHTVTLKAVYDLNEYRHTMQCGILNKDIVQYPIFDENGIASVKLPEGIYCVSILFDPSYTSTMERKIPRMVIVENINVDSDITVELNPDMATCLVDFQPLLPNGECMSLPSLWYNPETDELEVIPGNTKEIAVLNITWHKEYGMLYSYGGSSNFTGGISNIFDQGSLYINPLSADISIFSGTFATTDQDGYYLTMMNPIKSIQSSQKGEWSTDYSSNCIISTAHTEMFDKIPDAAWEVIPKSMLTVDFVYPNGEKFFMPIGMDSNGFEIRAAGLFFDNQLLKAALTGFETDAATEVWEKDEEGNDVLAGYNYTGTYMPTFFFTEEGVQDFVSLPMDTGLVTTEEITYDFGTPNDWYSFYNDEIIGKFGDSQPIACFNWRPYYDYIFNYETFERILVRSNILCNTPVGRLSDIIGANNFTFYATISTLDSDKYWDDPDRTDKSRVEINAEFSCQIIDGVQGKTEAYLYWDENKEDCYPPMVTMLQFRDAITGMITDRFEQADNAKVIISGNDFNVRIINEDMYPQVLFDEAPAEMKLEWRATGATEDAEWTQLDLTDLACDIRGFGKMYEASLRSVNGSSATGWFDVKVSMIDEAGNNMNQTISPAFKIDSCVGVEAMMYPEINVAVANGNISVSGCESPVVEVYSAAGMILNRVNGTQMNVSGLGHGVYLVKVTDGTKKVVRKVSL